MYGFSIPADRPGTCPKCKGTGFYKWGAGRPAQIGMCFSCSGTGRQDKPQIARNKAYNRYKVAAIFAS